MKEERSGLKIKGSEGEIILHAKAKDLDIRYRLEEFWSLDKVSLEAAKKEWHHTSLLRTDCFVRFIPKPLRLTAPIGLYFVYLEIRFSSKRICSLSKKRAIDKDFDVLVNELNLCYTEGDYDFLKSHIRTRMEASAKRHFGKIPVTEVLVELL